MLTDPDSGDTATFDTSGFTLVAGSLYSRSGTYGTLTFDTANGQLTYALDNNRAATQALGVNGQAAESFIVGARDSHGANAMATVTFAILGTNDAPTTIGQSQTVTYNTPSMLMAATLLTGASDPEGDRLHIAAASVAQHGATSVDASGNVTYTPYVGYAGSDSYSVTVADDHGGSAPSPVTITVGGVNGTAFSPGYLYGGGYAAGQTFDISGDGIGHQVRGSEYDDVMYGGVGVDSLNGGGGDDVIYGGAGKDVVTGGAGVDRVFGGAGADSFVFSRDDIANPAINGGRYDEIMDFEGAGDGYTGTGDILALRGFAAGTALTLDGAKTSASGDPTAHYYFVSDGTYHGEIIIHYSGNAILTAGDYGFI